MRSENTSLSPEGPSPDTFDGCGVLVSPGEICLPAAIASSEAGATIEDVRQWLAGLADPRMRNRFWSVLQNVVTRDYPTPSGYDGTRWVVERATSAHWQLAQMAILAMMPTS